MASYANVIDWRFLEICKSEQSALILHFFSHSLDPVGSTERHYTKSGQNTLDRETQRNTQLNRFSDYTRDTFNRQLDRLADDREADYTTRVGTHLNCFPQTLL